MYQAVELYSIPLERQLQHLHVGEYGPKMIQKQFWRTALNFLTTQKRDGNASSAGIADSGHQGESKLKLSADQLPAGSEAEILSNKKTDARLAVRF